MYFNYSQDELRAICRTHLESFEKWARIIIDLELTKNFGKDFLFVTKSDSNYFFKKELVTKAERMMLKEPTRFSKAVDTFFLDDIIYILCRADLYKNYFSGFLDEMYPEGVDELRTFLVRLIPIRNKLSHTQLFSIREAEQCVCYCNDFIDSIKKYFIKNGMSKQYNTPNIIKVNDSLGNEYHIVEGRARARINIVDPNTSKMKLFHFGEKFILWLIMDPSFDESEYRLEWTKKHGIEISEGGKKIVITINEELVGEEVVLFCRVISSKKWHRYLGYDQQLIVHFTGLPPQE